MNDSSIKSKVAICLQDKWVTFYSKEDKETNIQRLTSGLPVILQNYTGQCVIVNPRQVPALEVSDV